MLRIEDLSFRYAGQPDWVLQDITIEIARGECVLLAGGSGSGKSTLARCINGLIPHFERGERAGRVLLDGNDIADKPLHELALRVGSVFQNPRAQCFTDNPRDEIAFGCENLWFSYADTEQRVDRAIHTLQLSHLLERDLLSLSDGERQKVILAAIHAMDCDIIVWDEPSSNLDAVSVTALSGMIKALKAAGKTLIFAEHRLHYLADHIDRVLVLEKGRISRQWSSAEFNRMSNAQMTALGLRWRDMPPAHVSATIDDAIDADTTGAPPGVLEITQLTARFGRRQPTVFSGLSRQFAGGQIVAMTGRNGCGKTTLARVLCGLQKAQGGEIRIGGVLTHSRERVQRTRFIAQMPDYQLFAASVYQELMRESDDGGFDHAAALCALEHFGLAHLSERHPQTLSGGEKQRLVICAAVCSGRDIVILDEPTSGLDARSMHTVSAALRTLAERGALVLVISHDEEFIQTCCHQRLYLAATPEAK